jgi:hypothetical protein
MARRMVLTGVPYWCQARASSRQGSTVELLSDGFGVTVQAAVADGY